MSLVEFEKHKVVKSFMDIFDVYHTNLGGYRYSKDGSPCYQLNGMLTMFEEQQKKIDLLENEIVETQEFLNKQNHIKQAKIDAITKQRDSFIKAHHIAINDVCEHKAKIDELQARIATTEAWIEANKKAIALSEWHGYTTEEYVDADDLLGILKGNKDEN